MKSATRYPQHVRKQLGLLDLATAEDLQASVESSGEPSDPHKLQASQMFGVPYEQVTSEQRQAAKQRSYFRRYA